MVRKSGQLIQEVVFDDSQRWREKHLKTLEFAYGKARYFEDMMALAQEVYRFSTQSLSEFCILSVETVAKYYGLTPRFEVSSRYGVSGHASERLLELVRRFDGTVYLTGHGARNYLDHESFERAGVRVEYMDYQIASFRQLNGDFTPYVSVLDLIANEGKEGLRFGQSHTVYWREFVTEQSNSISASKADHCVDKG